MPPNAGAILYAAFQKVADQHNFPPDFPSVEAATDVDRGAELREAVNAQTAIVVEHLGDHRLQEHAHAVPGQDHVIGVRPAGQRELETLLRIGGGDAQAAPVGQLGVGRQGLDGFGRCIGDCQHVAPG